MKQLDTTAVYFIYENNKNEIFYSIVQTMPRFLQKEPSCSWVGYFEEN